MRTLQAFSRGLSGQWDAVWACTSSLHQDWSPEGSVCVSSWHSRVCCLRLWAEWWINVQRTVSGMLSSNVLVLRAHKFLGQSITYLRKHFNVWRWDGIFCDVSHASRLYGFYARTLPTSHKQTVWTLNSEQYSQLRTTRRMRMDRKLFIYNTNLFRNVTVTSLLPTTPGHMYRFVESLTWRLHIWQILENCSCENQGFGWIATPKNIHENLANTLSDVLRHLKFLISASGSLEGQPHTTMNCVFPVPIPCSHNTPLWEQGVPCSCWFRSLGNTKPLRIRISKVRQAVKWIEDCFYYCS